MSASIQSAVPLLAIPQETIINAPTVPKNSRVPGRDKILKQYLQGDYKNISKAQRYSNKPNNAQICFEIIRKKYANDYTVEMVNGEVFIRQNEQCTTSTQIESTQKPRVKKSKALSASSPIIINDEVSEIV